MAGGAAFADALNLRRKLKAAEEEERYKRLLASLERDSLAKTLGPDYQNLAGLDAGTALAEKDRQVKAKKEATDKDKARSTYLAAAGVGTNFGPTSPSTEREADVYADLPDASRGEMINKLSAQEQKQTQVHVGQALMSDPKRKATIQELSVLFPDNPDKWYKYAGRTLSDIQKDDDKDPQTLKWEHDIAIRKQARDLIAKGEQEKADIILQDNGLSLSDSGVVTEKKIREEYGRYVKREEKERSDPMNLIFTGTTDPVLARQKTDAARGPINMLGEWLTSPEALQLNPQLVTKMKAEYDARMQRVSELWQLEKLSGTTPDEFMKMLHKTDDIKDYLDDLTEAYIRSHLQ